MGLQLFSTGCYYGHLAVGQTKLLLARQSVDSVLNDPNTDAELRAKLEAVEQARAFASDLGLEVDGQYTSYVPWQSDRIVTSIIATRPGEIAPANFKFPIVGEVPYKGFFDKSLAEELAASLRAEGMDVCVGAIRAYSTLGWFDDPLTEPMLDTTVDRLVETVIHELVHATVFLSSQPDFNEGTANFIGEEATVLFYTQRDRQRETQSDRALENSDDATAPNAANIRARIDDERLVARTLMTLRDEVEALYGEDLAADERMAQRTALETSSRTRLAELPLTTRDPSRLSEHARLNDACLGIQGTYVADTPQHQVVLDSLNGDLLRFIARLREVADSDDPRATFFAP